MIASLGERIGEVETLARLFPEHEARMNGAVDGLGESFRHLQEELLGKHEELVHLFTNHTHDAPPAPKVEQDLVDAVDSPINAIDEALGTALPTPEAPSASPEVEAPAALKEAPVYRSRLHRHR